MRLHYECECERTHERRGALTAGLEGYSTDIDCGSGAKYVVNVTLLRSTGGD